MRIQTRSYPTIGNAIDSLFTNDVKKIDFMVFLSKLSKGEKIDNPVIIKYASSFDETLVDYLIRTLIRKHSRRYAIEKEMTGCTWMRWADDGWNDDADPYRLEPLKNTIDTLEVAKELSAFESMLQGIKSVQHLVQIHTVILDSEEWPTIERICRHTFGDQLVSGYDWFTLIWKGKQERRPVLVLQGEGPSGKSTFIRLCERIFGPDFVEIETVKLLTAIARNRLCALDGVDSLTKGTVKNMDLLGSGRNNYSVVPVGFVIATNSPKLVESLDNLSHVLIKMEPISDPEPIIVLECEVEAFRTFLSWRNTTNVYTLENGAAV